MQLNTGTLAACFALENGHTAGGVMTPATVIAATPMEDIRRPMFTGGECAQIHEQLLSYALMYVRCAQDGGVVPFASASECRRKSVSRPSWE